LDTIIDTPPEHIEMPAEITTTPTQAKSPKMSNRQMRSILAAILAGTASSKIKLEDPTAVVEIYHAIYKELKDKGMRPKV